jgi:ribosomal protein S18 acetylase RimI-like enzyme
VEARPWTPDLDAAVMAFLGDAADGRGACFCAAWSVPTWEAWGARTPAENRALREDLLRGGVRDGVVLLDGGAVRGWCQAGARDRFPKLLAQYGLAPDPAVGAVTCFEVAPGFRGRGTARLLLAAACDLLRAGGFRRVQAFPRPGARLEPGQAWTGPEALFRGAGFAGVGGGERGPVLERSLVESRTP